MHPVFKLNTPVRYITIRYHCCLTKLNVNINEYHEPDFPIRLIASLYNLFQVFIRSLPFVTKYTLIDQNQERFPDSTINLIERQVTR